MGKKAEKEIQRGRLPGNKRYRLKNLLHMRYKPSELAEELDVDVRWFYRVYVPLGCPHERDEWNHIWIIGTEFRDWYEATYRKRKLAENEAYCVSCKKVICIINLKQYTKEGLTYILCQCPDCDGTVAKILANQRKKR